MYTLKAKVNFYDKEHPGVLLHTGELLSTESEARARNLVERGFAEIVSDPKTSNNEVVKVSPENLADVRQALNAIGVKTAVNAGLKTVSDKVAVLSETQIAELKLKLSKTNK